MRAFFNKPHALIMQGIGGLIALIVMIPVGIYVVQSVFLSKDIPQAARSYAPPVTSGVSATPAANASGGSSASTGVVHTVKMQAGHAAAGFVFAPATLHVNIGDQVRWVDVNTVPHNIVGSGNAASVIAKSAIDTASYTVTFGKAGTYNYVCQVHQGMNGVIVVSGSAKKSGGSSTGSASGGTTVSMEPGTSASGYVFKPASITIHAGGTVHWVDANLTPHNIVGDGIAASVIKKAAVDTSPYSVTFTKPGTYHYVCQVHPGMAGVIKVV